jgi:hypothetical protein
VIASSSCSVMAAHSGDLLGDDTKDISAATCWLPLSDLVARWRASMNFFHTHPPTPLNQIARSRCRQRRILPTRLPCSVSSRWRVIVARLFTLEYTTVCGWNPFPSSRRKKNLQRCEVGDGPCINPVMTCMWRQNQSTPSRVNRE